MLLAVQDEVKKAKELFSLSTGFGILSLHARVLVILTLPRCGESTQILTERTEEPQVFQPPDVQVYKCGITCRIRVCTPATCNCVTAWGDLTEKPVANPSNHQMHVQKK